MTAHTSVAVGLSIGSTMLAAVTATGAVTGPPLLTRAGRPIDDFVERVGDPVGIIAADGSRHSGAALLADALRDLARTATAGRPLPADVAVAYPGHWSPAAVEALRRALRRVPPWSANTAQVTLLPGHAAALTALRAEPGLPARGVVAVCDFGGAATTITLVDVTDGFRTIAGPMRCLDFSGELIDRALLTHVLGAAGVTPGGTGTTAISELTRLRAECREAKERLSAQIVTTVAGRPAGLRGDIRLTRTELDAIVREPLTRVVAALLNILRRNGIALTDLTAVASVGGMAAVPAVTTTLSAQLRVPVITARRPSLAAATGAALCVARGAADAGATVVSPARSRPQPAQPPLAWAHAPDVPDVVPQLSTRPARPQPRPRVEFAPEPAGAPERMPWHRRPLAVAAATLAVIAGAGGATVLALHADTSAAPAPALPAPSISTTTENPEPAPVVPGPTADWPAPRTVPAVPPNSG
jgi:actin-like ATPase involved in cell morphogenesis